MNDVILHDDGAVTVMASGFSLAAELVERQARGQTVRIVDRATVKDQPERITAARAEAMSRVRRRRNARLKQLDIEQTLAFAGYHPASETAAEIETVKQAMRDLPATIQNRGDLDGKDAEQIDGYVPMELVGA